MVKMSELRSCFEETGFNNVTTYINSGNVIFESEEKEKEKLVEKVEKRLLSTFKMPLRVVVRSESEIKKTLDNVPPSWKARDDIRCYTAFVKEPLSVEEALKDFDRRDGVDFVDGGPGVVYMTTLLTGLTKSQFSKLAVKKVYKQITIRNYNTVRKIFEIMEK